MTKPYVDRPIRFAATARISNADAPVIKEAVFYRFREFYIPARMGPGILRYVGEHILLGDFLQAVISNDLRGACEKADDENLSNLPAYAAYAYNEMPGESWGSREKMAAWIKTGNDQRDREAEVTDEAEPNP